MVRTTAAAIFAIVMLLDTSARAGNSPSDLLERGIYTQETVGDLDQAISIYRKIISQDKANRRYVAEAYLRLGECQLARGKTEDAEKTLRTLIEQYRDATDQEPLVAKARKLLPNIAGSLELEPVPWVDGEQLELRIRLAGNLEIGAFILTAHQEKTDGNQVWHLGLSRNISMNAPNLGLSHVVADPKTFQPVRSLFRHTLLGKFTAEYAPGVADLRSTDTSHKETIGKVDLDGVYYDNEQAWHLFRRLPLSDNYAGEVPVFAPLGGAASKISAAVTGRETLNVPAGRFECFRVLLKPVQQTFWISTDSNRYIVKFEAGGVVGELQSVRQVKPGEKTVYRDQARDFSLTFPATWYSVPASRPKGSDIGVVTLVDPGALGNTVLRVEPITRLDEEHRTSVRTWAEHVLETHQKGKEDFRIDANSWQRRMIGGHPAISCIASFKQGELQRTEYYVFLVGKSTAARLVANTTSGQLDKLRRELDLIIDTYTVNQP